MSCLSCRLFRGNRKNYLSALRKSAKKITRGEAAIGQVVSKLGILAKGDIQQSIVDLRDPPNAASTIRAKGSSNPLIDTGEMKNSVDYETYG